MGSIDRIIQFSQPDISDLEIMRGFGEIIRTKKKEKNG